MPVSKDIFQTTAGKHLDIGCVMVLQTYGPLGKSFNPHLHILVTAGGLTEQGTWKAVTFIPYELMHKKMGKYHLLQMLREHVGRPPGPAGHRLRLEKITPMASWPILQPGDVPPGGKGLAEYLAKYVVSPPILRPAAGRLRWATK